MENKAPLRRFMGANSRYGFRSLYEHISNPEQGEFLYIIKGGPGCGKSSFMGRIGQAALQRGLDAEFILCSGDPDSLDGLILPQLGLAWVDGTAPHALEAAYPAGSAAYIDLGNFYDLAALRPKNPEIMELNRRYKALYAQAYRYLAAAGDIHPRETPGLLTPRLQQNLEKKLASLAQRQLPPLQNAKPGLSRRFISAYTCKGALTLPLPQARLWLLDNRLGFADFYLRGFARHAARRGYDLELWQDCLDPEKLSGVYIPRAELVLFAPEPGMELNSRPERHIHLDALASREDYDACKSRLRRGAKLSRSLLEMSLELLGEAKAMHDELEALYNPHVDFGGIYALAQAQTDSLLP